MQAADRFEFKTLLVKLCAGFDVPCTKAREEAYWDSLAPLSIGEFRRCVAFALSPEYPGITFPKTALMWKIHKGTLLPKPHPPQALPIPQAEEDTRDHLAYLANRLLFMHLAHRGGLGGTGEELQACLAFKREIVAEFEDFIRAKDPDCTPAAFVRYWLAGLREVSNVTPKTVQAFEEFATSPGAQQPFKASMARPLPPENPGMTQRHNPNPPNDLRAS